MILLPHKPQLNALAKRYIWWQDIAWAYQHPDVFLANIMNLGTWTDILILRSFVKDDVLRQILQHPPPGYFHQRSWDFWHLKLGVTPIPPLPKRNL